jgi:hypothetical protein
VLLDDRIAEHVPGCNMAFRRDALVAINGFNPVYLRAGDDVDICWRLQAKGWRVGFAPAALVWHHHRSAVKAYWRQQVGYGEGETWLGAHHPDKFISGQMLWRGRIYSPLPFVRSFAARRINSGVWGTAAFPSVYSTDTHPLMFLPHSPLWLAASLALMIGGAAGGLLDDAEVAWLPIVFGAIGWTITVARCLVFAWRSDLSGLPTIGTRSPAQSRRRYRALIAWLHLVQPLARFRGRIRGMWSLPRVVGPEHVTRLPWKMPVPTLRDALASSRLFGGGGHDRVFWSESWVSHTTLLTELTGVLRASQPTQLVEAEDGWHADRDLSLTIGRWGWLHVRALVEEHERGRCLVRLSTRLRPRFLGAVQALTGLALITGGAAAAMVLHRPSVGAILLAAMAAIAGRAMWQTTRTMAVLDRALARVIADAHLLPLDGFRFRVSGFRKDARQPDTRQPKPETLGG